MLPKYIRVNLEDMLEVFGEDRTRSILADFSCTKNRDVEKFLREKAIEFSKQSIAKTQLIYYVQNGKMKRLVGYFSLTHKIINVSKYALSNKYLNRIRRFAKYEKEKECYALPVILIGQIGKNYKDENDKFISGATLLELAFQSISVVQSYIGGKFVYLESEEKEALIEFYEKNGFVQFGKRKVESDYTDIDGPFLLQWICYKGNN